MHTVLELAYTHHDSLPIPRQLPQLLPHPPNTRLGSIMPFKHNRAIHSESTRSVFFFDGFLIFRGFATNTRQQGSNTLYNCLQYTPVLSKATHWHPLVTIHSRRSTRLSYPVEKVP